MFQRVRNLFDRLTGKSLKRAKLQHRCAMFILAQTNQNFDARVESLQETIDRLIEENRELRRECGEECDAKCEALELELEEARLDRDSARGECGNLSGLLCNSRDHVRRLSEALDERTVERDDSRTKLFNFKQRMKSAFNTEVLDQCQDGKAFCVDNEPKQSIPGWQIRERLNLGRHNQGWATSCATTRHGMPQPNNYGCSKVDQNTEPSAL